MSINIIVRIKQLKKFPDNKYFMMSKFLGYRKKYIM